MPGWSDKQFATLVGLSEAKRQLAQLPEVVRGPSYTAIRASTDALAAAAQARAPRRADNAIPGYRGGALEARIVARTSLKHLIGMVGIARGLLVVTRRGRVVSVTRRMVVAKADRNKAGHRYRRRRLLGRAQRQAIAKAGGIVIQPTKYGHLMEFGTPKVAARSFLRPVARRQQAPFEADLRQTVPDVIRALQQLGHHPGGAA